MRLHFGIVVLLLTFLVAQSPQQLDAQVRPVYSTGAAGLGQIVKRLNTSARVMMIGAHPDDEDTALLAYLARGENAHTAYLSLTRGDGGQNRIGPELGEALGVIRTEELLQARAIDGAEQYFTRAYDFGFSKTLAETKQKWNEEVLLCDTVAAIRRFKPLVVISRFSGTPADGHGQHQFAGYISPLAVKAAGEFGKCPGTPWKVHKFYVSHGFRATGTPKLRINTGRYDHMLGRSYFEIAMEARSQHKSQEQGVLELKGDQFSGMNLVGNETTETGIFDGMDVTVSGIPPNTGNREGRFGEAIGWLAKIASDIQTQFDPRDPKKLLPLLAAGYKQSYDAEWATRNPESKSYMQQKRDEFAEAIRLASGLQIDLLADREFAVPGEAITATAKVFYPNSAGIEVKDISLKVPLGWRATVAEAAPSQNSFRAEIPRSSRTFSIAIPTDAAKTQAYWLENPRNGDMFVWPSADFAGEPFQPQPVAADVKVLVAGHEILYSIPIQYRFADDIHGEVRREFNIVPSISIEMTDEQIVIPATRTQQDRDIGVSITNNSAGPAKGTLKLIVPPSWKVQPNSVELNFNRSGEKRIAKFNMTIPAAPEKGTFNIAAEASVGGEIYRETMHTIEYPHINTHRYYRKTFATAVVLDLAVEDVKVGYIAGSGDKVPDAIRRIGRDVEMLDENQLTAGDLSQFDVIIAGVRSYQVRPDLAANNQRLLEYVNGGGTLIVQYQQPSYAQQKFAPYPTEMGPRVADEKVAVTLLRPGHPILSFPNKLGSSDFANWVQERNLYNFSKMDEKYIGLLEAHDIGEPENAGGLVVADFGKGKFVYCGYSLFRQLPAGVPGAYRLLANLISLPKAKK